jgi:fructose-specific phosphotransferase system IIA component
LEKGLKISEFFREELINLSLKSQTKEECIRELGELMNGDERITDYESFLRDVYEREKVMTTGIGSGVAIPHARSKYVSRFIISFGRSSVGIDFDSLDKKPVHLVFMMGAAIENIEEYLKILAHLTRLLKGKHFRDCLMKAKTPKDVITIFRKAEE